MNIVSKDGVQYAVVRYDERKGASDRMPLPPFGFPELGKADGKWQFFGAGDRRYLIQDGVYIVAPVVDGGYGTAFVFGTEGEYRQWLGI